MERKYGENFETTGIKIVAEIPGKLILTLQPLKEFEGLHPQIFRRRPEITVKRQLVEAMECRRGIDQKTYIIVGIREEAARWF